MARRANRTAGFVCASSEGTEIRHIQVCRTEVTDYSYVFINLETASNQAEIWKILKEYGAMIGIEDRLPQILEIASQYISTEWWRPQDTPEQSLMICP